MDHFGDYRDPQEVLSELEEYDPDSIMETIHVLHRLGFLVPKDSKESSKEKLIEQWRHWDIASLFFHIGTKDIPFIVGTGPEKQALIKSLYETASPPPLFKTYLQAEQIQLIRERNSDPTPFFDVLLKRRTTRSYSGRPLSLKEVSDLLLYTWGRTGKIETPSYGELLLKTSPSGGARHPIEVYPILFDVEEAPPGIYHYNVRDHSLELLKRGDFRKRHVEYCVGQSFVAEHNAAFIMTALFERTSWKYRNDRAYRIILIEAGHFAQTFCLVATCLGLGPFVTAALKDTMIEQDLGIDGFAESVVYLCGVGTVQQQPDEAGIVKDVD